jgi:WXG100 family type VII secretion target
MKFDVTPDDLLRAAAQCQSTNQQIQGQIGQIERYIQGLMGAYQGPAATQLMQTAMRWAVDALALNLVLDKIATNLRTNAHNYGHGENTNVVNLARIEGTLGAAKL